MHAYLRKFTGAVVMLFAVYTTAAQVPAVDTLPRKDTLIEHKTPDSVTVATYYRINSTYFKSYWTDLKYVVARPAHWQKRDWLKFTAVAAGIGGMLTLDKSIKQIALRNHSRFNDDVTGVIEPFGNFYGSYIFPALLVTGLVTKQKKIQHVALSGAKSLVISTLIYTAAKKMIRRQRPDHTESPFNYKAPFMGKGYTSSPSGHSNTIFTVATALALEYKEKKWVAPILYTLASATAISRIYQNRHWTSDVIMGSLLGHFVTKAVWRNNHKKFSRLAVP